MKRKLMLIAALFACGMLQLHAEDASEANASGDCDQAQFVTDDLEQSIKDYISGKPEVFTDDVKYYIGVGNIAVAPGNKGYALSRTIAYRKAALAARKQFATYLEQTVKSAMESSMAESSGFVAGENKTQKLIREQVSESLKAQAAAQGIDVSKPGELEKYIKNNVVNSSNFSQQISSAGLAFQQGLMVYKSFATPRQVGVIMIFNERNKKVAESLRNGGRYAPTGAAGSSILARIPKDPTLLANSFGARILRDEKGEYCIVAYGHGVAATQSQMSKNTAKKKAALAAINEIKEFAGEQIAFDEAHEAMESAAETTANEISVANEEKFNEVVKQKASSLKITGARNLSNTLVKLPSGETIAVCVTVWNPKDALFPLGAPKNLVKSPNSNVGTYPVKPAPAPSRVYTEKVDETQYKPSGISGSSNTADLD